MKFGAPEGLFAKAGLCAVISQRADGQFYRGKAGEEKRHAAGVVSTHSVKHAQPILVAIVTAAQG